MFLHLKHILGHKVKEFKGHFNVFTEGKRSLIIQVIKECVTSHWTSLQEKINTLESNVINYTLKGA